MFYQLALRFYYGKAAIAQVIDNPGPTAGSPVRTCNYWMWDADKGLVRTEVPAEIFNDLMTLRTCEQSMTLAQDASADAVALWLDADNKREADLPSGATDPVRGDQPSAHYFNVSSGARHIDDALARALSDRNAQVALKLTHSLSQIVGHSSLDGRIGDPLTEALRFPDKRVRYEAALALGRSLPSKSFANQELVVPLLVEAIGAGAGAICWCWRPIGMTPTRWLTPCASSATSRPSPVRPVKRSPPRPVFRRWTPSSSVAA
jgi:hypothetical protein